MKPFAYERAADAAGAVAPSPRAPRRGFLAGGTNLVDLMKLGVADARAARRRRALRLDRIERRAGRRPAHRRRACATATSPRTRACASATRCSRRRCWPGASGSCATWPRSAATCCSARAAPTSRTSPSPATSARPGTGCPAREGDHRNLAILGHSAACVATHPSDMAVALAALDAVVHVARAGGDRAIADAGPAPAARRPAASATPCSSPAS